MLLMRHDIAELEARLLLTIPGLYIHRMAVRIGAKAPEPQTLNPKPESLKPENAAVGPLVVLRMLVLRIVILGDFAGLKFRVLGLGFRV